MFIYVVSRTDRNRIGYDEFVSFVCIARDDKQARSLKPGGFSWPDYDPESDGKNGGYYADEGPEPWKYATVHCVGKAHEGQSVGVINASFNAG